MRLCCLAGLFFIWGFPLAAQLTGELTGKVLDADLNTPIQNAVVSLREVDVQCTTRRDGVYLFQGLAPGLYSLRVEAEGYAPHIEESVLLRAGQLTRRNILLQAAVPRLGSVVVQAAVPVQTQYARTAVISQEAIRERNVTTFDQAVEAVSGVQVQRSHSAMVQSLSIRGSSDVAGGGIGNRVLLLIDGRPALSPESGGALWTIVPTNAIDRVEVAKGAASSLYGSSAMGGVINVITKKPAEGTHLTLHANLGMYEQPKAFRYTERTPLFGAAELEASVRRGRWGTLLNVGRKASDGYSEQSAYALHNVYTKVIYDIDRDREIRLSLGFNALDNDFPHSWISRLQPLRVLPKYGDDFQRKRELSADLYYHAIASTRLKYSSRFYYYRNRATSYFNEHDPELKRRANQPYRFRTHVDAKRLGHLTQMDLFLGEAHYLIAGIDLQWDRVRSSPKDVMYGDHDAWNAAGYAQYEWRPDSKWRGTAGLRYDRNQLIDGPALARFSPRLSLSYAPSPRWEFRLLGGQAFRSPSIAERFFRKEIASGINFRPNPDLRAERLTLSLEAGVTWTPLSQVTLDVAYYVNHYKDLIYWVDLSADLGLPFGTLFQVQNLNRAVMRGIDATLQMRWGNWLRFQANYAYLDAQDRSPGRRDDTLAYKVRHTFSYQLSLERASWQVTLSGRYRSRVEEVFLWPNDEPEAFHVHNLRLSRRVGRREVYVAINNLFNAQYEELARYRMPGRHASVGFRLRF